jgi:predicted transcriptional regulator
MHIMNTTLHNNIQSKSITDSNHQTTTILKREKIKGRKNNSNDKHNNTDVVKDAVRLDLPNKVAVLDIVRENRLAKVISLYSKGLNQEQIAQELDIDQSTVSRDLQSIKQEATWQIEKYLREDILTEYLRYIVGSNEITRNLWEIVQDKDTKTKERTNALSVLMQVYNSRLQTLTTGPESYMNIKKSLSEIDLQRTVDNNPMLKAQALHRKMFPKGLLNHK